MLNAFTDFILTLVNSIGYLEVFFLMTLESSFIPFPSEIVIPPAAYLASQGNLNVYLVIFFGVAGSLIGALINYFLALKLGRLIIYRLASNKVAKFFLINKEKINKSEKYFLKHGALSTFFGRLIPVIRQLISLPAGLSKMNLAKFVFYTSLGSFIWVTLLAILGYVAGEKQELIIMYYKEIVLIIILFFIILYILKRVITKIRKK